MKLIIKEPNKTIEIGDVVIGRYANNQYLVVELEDGTIGALNLNTLKVQFSEQNLQDFVLKRTISLLAKGNNIKMILGGEQ